MNVLTLNLLSLVCSGSRSERDFCCVVERSGTHADLSSSIFVF